MSTTVQHRRGTTENHASFVGADGEITVDTTKDVTVVHDGVTPGGHPQTSEEVFLSANRYTSVILPPAHWNGGQGTNRNIGDNSLKMTYMGRCPRRLVNAPITARMRTTGFFTAGNTGTTWAEMVIATGSIIPGGAPTLRFIAWAEVATIINAPIGLKQVTFSSVSLDAEADWWIGIGNSIGSGGTPNSATLRSFTLGDDLLIGIQGTIDNVRPSANIGNVFPLTVDGSTTNALWIAAII